MAGRLKLEDVQEVFKDISAGDSLRTACSKKGRPTLGRVLYAIQCDPSIFEQYARARSCRAELLAEEIIEIADTDPDPQRSRVRVDARKWYASKVNKTYADRQEVTVKTAPLSDEELEAEIKRLSGNVGMKVVT